MVSTDYSITFVSLRVSFSICWFCCLFHGLCFHQKVSNCVFIRGEENCARTSHPCCPRFDALTHGHVSSPRPPPALQLQLLAGAPSFLRHSSQQYPGCQLPHLSFFYLISSTSSAISSTWPGKKIQSLSLLKAQTLPTHCDRPDFTWKCRPHRHTVIDQTSRGSADVTDTLW